MATSQRAEANQHQHPSASQRRPEQRPRPEQHRARPTLRTVASPAIATATATARTGSDGNDNSACPSGHGQRIATHNNNKMTKTRTLSSHQSLLHQSNPHSGRMKRPLTSIDSVYDPLKTKRARIAVEILARPKPQSQSVSLPRPIAVQPTQIPTKAQQHHHHHHHHQQQQHHHHHHRQKPTVAPPPENPLPSPSPPSLSSLPLPPTQPRDSPKDAPKQKQKQKQKQIKTETILNTTTISQPASTRQQSKVKNGIKHELDKLQPSATDANSTNVQSGRKLRSQEATRFKSELSAYFPDYDEVIGNDPKEQHILNLDTPIVVIDTDSNLRQDARLPPPPPPQPSTAELSNIPLSQPASRTTSLQSSTSIPIRHYSRNLFTDLLDSQRVDFTFLEARYNGKNVEDPLPDWYFQPAHKKAERLEKSIRNTEKGRAQHEKDQIIRLLNELQGHDWLRTMGVNGVTETKKKTFEPARDHFIRGCQAILEKFRLWSQEEKRRKLEKERALAEAEQREEEDEDEDEDDNNASEIDEETGEDEEDAEDVEVSETGDGEDEIADDVSDGDPPDYPDYSDVDASIAKQLSEEASARVKYTTTNAKKPRGEPPTWSPELHIRKEFTSFFGKRHQRDAALNHKRRRGRTAMAWGHPIPDIPEYDFDLPEEYRDEETLKGHARQKRRARREGKHC